ncbi:MAG: hypothetical protein RTU30_08495 [Candidatus Thorarchaeota archaeon]
MLQTIPEILVSGLIILVTIVVLNRLGARAKESSTRIEQNVLKLPLPNPEEIDDTHRSEILQMKRKWQREAILGGLSSADFWMYCLIPATLIIYDFVPTILLAMLIFLFLFLISGFVIGIVRIVGKSSFWDAQLNPVKGIEADLERSVQENERYRPQESSARQFYPEVELNIRTNWERAIHSSLNQQIIHEIYKRELTPDDSQLLLEYLARHEDIIGQTAREIQRDIAMCESAEH